MGEADRLFGIKLPGCALEPNDHAELCSGSRHESHQSSMAVLYDIGGVHAPLGIRILVALPTTEHLLCVGDSPYIIPSHHFMARLNASCDH